LPRKRRGRRRRWLVYAGGGLLVIVVAVLAGQRAILRSVALCAIVDEGSPDDAYVVIGGGDKRYEIAAERVLRGRCPRILLFQGRRSRLVIDGIVPPGYETAIEQLSEHGVDLPRIHVIEGETRDLWECADRLNGWLASHPGARVVILCERFGSRRMRYVLDHVLPEDLSERVAVEALRDRRYDESNWSESRTGWKSLFGAGLGLAYCAIAGRPAVYPEPWDPDIYEQQLREMTGRLSP
jgi:uncharacterized SAM-binding protein YcdF (DUF218 family)